MTMPTLTMLERSNIDNGPWFTKLSPALQRDILERSHVRRLRDGELAAVRGSPAQEWCGVAAGAEAAGAGALAACLAASNGFLTASVTLAQPATSATPHITNIKRVSPANAADPASPGRWRCPLEGERRSRFGGGLSNGIDDSFHALGARIAAGL